MADKTTIIKTAVARMGAEVPTGLGDDTDEMAAANLIYASVVTEFLCKHAWTFATKYQALTVDATAPPLPYKTRYPIPAGCLNIRDVLDQFGSKIAYELVEAWIYTFRDPTTDPTLLLNFNWYPTESLWPYDFAAAVEEETFGRLLEAFDELIRGGERRQVAKAKLAAAHQRDRRQKPPTQANRRPLLRAWLNIGTWRQ